MLPLAGMASSSTRGGGGGGTARTRVRRRQRPDPDQLNNHQTAPPVSHRRRSRKESSPPPPLLVPEEDCSGVDAKEMKRKVALVDLELQTTLGTGTFGRVVLSRHRPSGQYFALKVMAISEVIRLKQVEHVKNEKQILSAVKHPFIVHMLWAEHNDRFLYMLLEFICGGELFSYLRNAGRFNNETSLFYAAEIVSALEYLHKRNVVYRDLKPENLLLDREGHLKITDFGFAKVLLDRTWTLCGTPEYLAPEIIQSKGHNKAVDWWALGILIFEMQVGMPPFFDENPFAIYQKILKGHIEWPRCIDHVAKDLVKKLLVLDRTKRLGNMKNGTDDVRKHKWFKHLRWQDVYDRKLKPAIVPRLRHEGDARNFFPDETWGKPPTMPKNGSEGDTTNFDEYAEDDWNSAPTPSAEDAAQFLDF